MALARLDIPGLVLYGGSIAPGRWHDRDVTIQDVFEAVGAHAAGTLEHAGPRLARAPGLPGRRRLRRPVHRQHDGDRVRDASASRRSAAPAFRPIDEDKVGASPARAGALVMDVLKRGVRPRQIITARRARERHRRGRRHRRLDQRRAAPARHRQRSAACRSTSTTSTASTRGCRCSPISSRAAASSPPICIAPAASRSSRSGCSKAGICTPTRSRSPAGRSASTRAKRRKRRTRSWCGRWRTRSSRPAAWSSSRAISRRKARW